MQKGNIGDYPYRLVDIPVPKKMEDEYKSLVHLYDLIREFSPRAIINNDNIYLSNLLPYFAPEIVRLSVVHGFRRIGLNWDAHLVIFNAALVNYQHVDYIIALSTPMKEAIINKLGCPDDQVKVVFNGLIRSTCERKKLQYPGRPIQIVFGGGNNRTKGADVFFFRSKNTFSFKYTRLSYYMDRACGQKGEIFEGEFEFNTTRYLLGLYFKR